MNLGDLVKLYGTNPAPQPAQTAPKAKQTGSNQNRNSRNANGASPNAKATAPVPPQPQYGYGYGYPAYPYPQYYPYNMYQMPGTQMQSQTPVTQSESTAQPQSGVATESAAQTANHALTADSDSPIVETIQRESPEASTPTQPATWVPPVIRPNFVPAPPQPQPGTMLYPGMTPYPPGFRPPNNRGPKRQKQPKPPKSSDDEDDDAGADGSPVFSCEPCEKDFKQKKFYDAHMKQHLPCPYEGCTFTAVRGVLKMHEIMHMKNMLSKLETPEEIERYRAERRKRYPTTENVKKKQEEEELKRKERGDLFDRKPKQRDSKNSKRDQQRQNRGRQSKNQGDSQQQQQQPAPAAEATVPASDQSQESQNQPTEFSQSQESQQPQQQQPAQRDRKRPRFPCKFWRQGRCSKGEHCQFSHDEEPQPRKRQKTNEGTQKSTSGSLMDMFINEEATKEHDAIMHCLRFIVANKFFQR